MSSVQLESEKGVYGGGSGNAAVSAGERRQAALAEIDEAKFSWFHVKACIVAGEFFFSRSLVALADLYQAWDSLPTLMTFSPSPSRRR